MAKVNVSIPQGTRDFNAETIQKRNYIFNTIRSTFELYGFAPLETPAMENLETLMGKYGEEGYKLIFKILNNGLDNAEKRNQIQQSFENILVGKNDKTLTERALRYDLTIPFARYVAMNYGQLSFPFKRYQIQPVWRADRPQRGRYREFYQCDADVVGSNSLLNEVELANIYSTVFNQLNIDVEIKINSRKILQALAELCGNKDKMIDITVAIDKLDKIGINKVKEELLQRGLLQNQIDIIEKYLSIINFRSDDVLEQLNNIVTDKLKELFSNTEIGLEGIKEVEFVLENCNSFFESKVYFDPTLARGLNYYTGIIFEVKATGVQMGSIGGGGRYDDLTSLFGVPNISGVGISFGVDRIYDVMEELQLFPAKVFKGTTVLFFNTGNEESKAAYGLMQQLRNNNISCEMYHEVSKFDKQFKYAEKKNIPYIIIIGEKELNDKTCVIKNLTTSTQETIDIQALQQFIFE